MHATIRRLRFGLGMAGSLLLTLGCGASNEAQREACFAKADSLMIKEAIARCAGYQWDKCPLRDEIRDKYRVQRRECP